MASSIGSTWQVEGKTEAEIAERNARLDKRKMIQQELQEKHQCKLARSELSVVRNAVLEKNRTEEHVYETRQHYIGEEWVKEWEDRIRHEFQEEQQTCRFNEKLMMTGLRELGDQLTHREEQWDMVSIEKNEEMDTMLQSNIEYEN